MNQIELQFFWPLTEQMPLDLDYSVCEKPKTTVGVCAIDSQTIEFNEFNSSLNYITTFTIDDNVVIKTKKLSWFGRLLYSTMGLKWEQKTY